MATIRVKVNNNLLTETKKSVTTWDMGKSKGSVMLREASDKVGGQAELARRCGVKPQQVNQWVSGSRKPSRVAALMLSAKYRIPIGAWDEIEKETECHN